MSDDFSSIKPQPVALSHTATGGEDEAVSHRSQVTWVLAGLVGVGLLIVVFFVLPQWLEGTAAERSSADSAGADAPRVQQPGPSTGSRQARVEVQDDQLPPYQALLREQTRTQAQEELARFVELQLKLESEMTVGAWGAAEYDAAKDLAAAGDEAFVKEAFENSLQQYQAASEALALLIERGRTLLETSLADGEAALAARDQQTANEAFALAAAIAPDDPRVAAGMTRASALPAVGDMMREARNFELAEQWQAALDLYQEVARLDAETKGLDEAVARATEGARQARIQEQLSQGFARLDAGAFEAARKAFRAALQLAPGDPVATGGLEQVDKAAAVARLNGLKRRAEAAAAAERWKEAADLYGQVLATDANIQFAVSGRAQARNQQRLESALARIIQSPDKLSSEKLYRDAQALLEEAEQLSPRGPQLASQIVNVQEILRTYAAPVVVTLRSDDRTRITLSTVGELGQFTEKQLQLRPGAYTVIGSRDGCRDVREQILVRPNMLPVDIRCIETL